MHIKNIFCFKTFFCDVRPQLCRSSKSYSVRKLIIFAFIFFLLLKMELLKRLFNVFKGEHILLTFFKAVVFHVTANLPKQFAINCRYRWSLIWVIFFKFITLKWKLYCLAALNVFQYHKWKSLTRVQENWWHTEKSTQRSISG